MKINVQDAEWLQYWLVDYFPFDSPSPNFLAYEEETVEYWEFVVNMIYRLVVCGLLDVLPKSILKKHSEYSFDGVLGFCEELAKQNPSDRDGLTNAPMPWIGPSLSMTEKAKGIVDKYFSDTPLIYDEELELNEKFIQEIEKIFEEYDVSMSEGSIIKVKREA